MLLRQRFFLVCGLTLAITLSLGLEGTSISAQEVEQTDSSPAFANQLSVDERLRKNVDFWIRIYTQYTTDQGLIHDAKYIDHVYETLDFEKINGKSSQAIRRSKNKWKQVLLSLHQKHSKFLRQSKNQPIEANGVPGNLTQDEQKVFDLFKDVQDPPAIPIKNMSNYLNQWSVTP